MEYLNAGLPEDIKAYIYGGYFEKAIKLINIYLTRNLSIQFRDRLKFELTRLEILKKQYIYNLDDALIYAKSRVKDFTIEELKNLIDEGYADWIFIEGQKMLNKSFLGNIIKVNSHIRNRLIEKPDPDLGGELRKNTLEEIIKKGKTSYYFHLRTGLKISEDENIKGNKIKVHIPIPRSSAHIKNIEIIETNKPYKAISPAYHLQRTIYFEEELVVKDKLLPEDKHIDENIFLVDYYFENHVDYVDLDYDKVTKWQPNFCLNEEDPHIKFSPYLVNLAKELVGDEVNPLKKARLIYDYITRNIRYSYVRPYIAIESIAEYCAYNLKGDCGLQALLFITLCRISGIPARWQSGLYVNPHYIGCHDWAQFYIEPYGWLFADTSFGGGARRNHDFLGWNFYFGNIDPFRMVANEAFQHPLYPEKKHLRADPYDNQIGEAETDVMGLNDYVEEILEVIEVGIIEK